MYEYNVDTNKLLSSQANLLFKHPKSKCRVMDLHYLMYYRLFMYIIMYYKNQADGLLI